MTRTDPIANIIRPSRVASTAEWAERYRRVTAGPVVGSAESVRWSNETFPLQRRVMDACDSPRWSKVVLMTSPQTFGKTDVAINAALSRFHQRRQSVVYVAASASLGYGVYRKKIEPAIAASPPLAELIPFSRDDVGDKTRHDFLNGASLYVVGAESAAALSGHTTPVVVCDDVQAMPKSLPGFGHPVDVALARANAFRREQRLLLVIGTAGTVDDYLSQSLFASTMFAPFVACPACDALQLIEFDRLEFDATNPMTAREGAWLVCASCGERIAESLLPSLLRSADWYSLPPSDRPIDNWLLRPPPRGSVLDRGTAKPYPHTDRQTDVAGFWSNALYWPFTRWSEHAAEYVSRKNDANPEALKDFSQNRLTIPWSPPALDLEALEDHEIAEHVGTSHRVDLVPETADCVTVTIDVQAGYAYWVVRAWCRETGRSWLVRAGVTRKFHGLRKGERVGADERERRHAAGVMLALQSVRDEIAGGWERVTDDGEIMSTRIEYAGLLIDQGYQTDVVFRWAHSLGLGKHRAIRGSPNPNAPIWPWKPTRTSGRVYWPVGVCSAKHVLRELLRLPPESPAYWELPADMPEKTLATYCRHLSSEEWNAERKKWTLRKGAGANHWLDCETYQIAAAIAAGVRLPALNNDTRRADGESAAARSDDEQTRGSSRDESRGSYFAATDRGKPYLRSR